MGWNAAGILHQAGHLLGRQNEIFAVERQAELPDGGLLIFYLNVQILAPQDFLGHLRLGFDELLTFVSDHTIVVSFIVDLR